MTAADEHAAAPTVAAAPALVRQQRPPPIRSLDGLRAVAVLIVLVSHAGYGEVVPGGLGVTIFFFLSGYLITTLLLDEHGSNGRIHIGHFYLRRAFRLLPPLFVLLAIAYGLVALGWLSGGFSWDGLTSQVFYYANYFQILSDDTQAVPTGTGILWSLAVEEHFYILYPALMFVLLRVTSSRRAIALLFGVLCVLALLWRIWLVSRPGFDEIRTYYATDTRFDSILYGCILALVCNPARLPPGTDRSARMGRSDWALLGGGLVLLVATVVYREPDFRETFRYSLQGIALLPIFYYAVRFATTRPFTLLSTRPLVRIGILSYGIYLSHFVVLAVIDENVDVVIPRAVNVVLALLGAVLFAEFVDRVVDPYFRRRRAALH